METTSNPSEIPGVTDNLEPNSSQRQRLIQLANQIQTNSDYSLLLNRLVEVYKMGRTQGRLDPGRGLPGDVLSV